MINVWNRVMFRERFNNDFSSRSRPGDNDLIILQPHKNAGYWHHVNHKNENFHLTFYDGCNYLSMMGLKLN